MIKKANVPSLGCGGRDLSQSCTSNVAKITVPTSVVQAKGDSWGDMGMIDEYYGALQVETETHRIKGRGRCLEADDWRRHSPEAMLDSVNKHC
jgi:hypothetical protein